MQHYVTMPTCNGPSPPPYLHNGKPVVDLRDPSSPHLPRLRSAASLPATLGIGDLLAEFPPRGVPFLLLYDASPPCLAALALLRRLTLFADAEPLDAAAPSAALFWAACPPSALLPPGAPWPPASRRRFFKVWV